MATSKPYSKPTDERVDSVDTLLGGARGLLKSSGDIMTAMSQNASLALSLQCNRDLKRMVKLDREGSRASKVLHSLRDDTVPRKSHPRCRVSSSIRRSPLCLQRTPSQRSYFQSTASKRLPGTSRPQVEEGGKRPAKPPKHSLLNWALWTWAKAQLR